MKDLITLYLLLALLLVISILATSCRTIDTYHYKDNNYGGTMVQDNGSNEQSAIWINTRNKHLTRSNWFILQKERPYVAPGYNEIIYDTIYINNNKEYHLLKYINNDIDTITQYFYIHLKQ